MSDINCPLCNELIVTGQIRKDWWMSDTDKRIAHASCIVAFKKGVIKGNASVRADLEFAHKRAMVLANMVGACGHKSPEATGTILGNVRSKVEEMQSRIASQYEEGRRVERHTIAQKLNGIVNDGITTAIHGTE